MTHCSNFEKYFCSNSKMFDFVSHWASENKHVIISVSWHFNWNIIEATFQMSENFSSQLFLASICICTFLCILIYFSSTYSSVLKSLCAKVLPTCITFSTHYFCTKIVFFSISICVSFDILSTTFETYMETSKHKNHGIFPMKNSKLVNS